MNDSFWFPVKTAIFAMIYQFSGLYGGAVIIAFIAAFVRLSYRAEDCETPGECRVVFFKLLMINLGIGMFCVHVGLELKYSQDLIIIISSVLTVLSKETMDTLMYTAKLVKKRVANNVADRIGGADDN